MSDQPLLAFVHIPKAAGTTLIHILRRNFLLQYLDVRTFGNQPGGVFSSADLKKVQRINPWLRCIAGHSVAAYSDLESVVPGIRYITVLRNPVERTVSEFLHLKDNGWWKKSFEDYLGDDRFWNRQVRLIGGRCSAKAAIHVVAEKFFVVGITEEIDGFILQLQHRLGSNSFDAAYKIQNTAASRTHCGQDQAHHLITEYSHVIKERNREDQILYDFVINSVLPKQREEFGSNYEVALRAFSARTGTMKPRMWKSYLDYVVRKIYFEPVQGAHAKANGLPFKETILRVESCDRLSNSLSNNDPKDPCA